jgi:hypothetical protein
VDMHKELTYNGCIERKHKQQKRNAEMKNQTLIAQKYAFDGALYFKIIDVAEDGDLIEVQREGFESFELVIQPDGVTWADEDGDQFSLTENNQ